MGGLTLREFKELVEWSNAQQQWQQALIAIAGGGE